MRLLRPRLLAVLAVAHALAPGRPYSDGEYDAGSLQAPDALNGWGESEDLTALVDGSTSKTPTHKKVSHNISKTQDALKGRGTMKLRSRPTVRCGYSWVDASAKCGPECKVTADCAAKYPWELLEDGVPALPGHYDCYKDLGECDPVMPSGECVSLHKSVDDSWCMECAVHFNKRCADFHALCLCEDIIIPKMSPIEKEPNVTNATDFPKITKAMKAKVLELYKKADDLGIPDCTWRPPVGCTNVTQYECLTGKQAGRCSSVNWADHPDHCSASCVHISLLKFTPFSAMWSSGPPRAAPWSMLKNKVPHYSSRKEHNNAVFFSQTPAGKEGVSTNDLMSKACSSADHNFVAVTMYSEKYVAKVQRWIISCDKVSVCCKGTRLRSGFFGPSAPEGSESFRYQFLANKPAFILEQLHENDLPIVFMDSDLEFRKYPKLLSPGSWPNYPRDVALFNYWGNETKAEFRATPHIGSGIMFFNQTERCQKLLVAWVESMLYKTNKHAPDDQVLDTLLKEGKWIKRVSLGWFPATYMKMMPAFYHGVDPVVDHDRSTMPGLIPHSATKPLLPPVQWWEDIKDKDNTGSLKNVTAPWEKQRSQKSYAELTRQMEMDVKPGSPMKPSAGLAGRIGHEMRCGSSYQGASTGCGKPCKTGADQSCSKKEKCWLVFACIGSTPYGDNPIFGATSGKDPTGGALSSATGAGGALKSPMGSTSSSTTAKKDPATGKLTPVPAPSSPAASAPAPVSSSSSTGNDYVPAGDPMSTIPKATWEVPAWP